MAHVLIVGAGLVGLSTAWHLVRAGHRVTVLDKEASPARHQSGRNSGVLHSGLYYRPGSLKARFAREGNRRLRELAAARGIAHEICGKVVLATTGDDEARLVELERRGADNGVAARRLTAAQLAAREPHARPGEALLVEEAGIIDYPAVAAALTADLERGGGALRCGIALAAVEPSATGAVARLEGGERLPADLLVNCAGLHADRVARLAGLRPPVRIVPFRGEYWRLVPPARRLVAHLLYPVPDPALPFLGVHLHRTIGGEVMAGPNAVLAGRREGYRRRDLSPRDLAEVASYGGFWRLAVRYPGVAVAEAWRSLSKRRFAASLRRLVPALTTGDLLPAPSGVRAQALGPDGSLVDDFLVVAGEGSLHVLNAPSPAATSCLPIGEHLAGLAVEALA